MDITGVPPPPKKSRFFSNGKSKIETLLRGKKDEQQEQGKPDIKPNHEKSSSSAPDIDIRYVSAARAVKFVSIGRSHEISLASRSSALTTPSSSITSSQATENPILSMCANSRQHIHLVAPGNRYAKDSEPAAKEYQNQIDQAPKSSAETQLSNKFVFIPNHSSGMQQQQQQQQNEQLFARQNITNSRSTGNSFGLSANTSNTRSKFGGSDVLPVASHSLCSGSRAILSSRSSSSWSVPHDNEVLRSNIADQTTHTTTNHWSPQQNLHPGLPAANMNSKVSFNTMLSPFSNHLNRPLEDGKVDTDRDEKGVLLPSYLRQHETQMFSRPLPVRCPAREVPTTPANFYTSPKRIEHAIAISALSLKRKRTYVDSPPAAHIYVHTGDPDFNIFSNGFLMYPELCFTLAAQMPLRDLVSLYSISRDFHTIIDTRFTTVCLTTAMRKAPQSAQIFKFRAYAQFCRYDPAARIPPLNPANAASRMPRKIPSFQWVAFIIHREKVVHELMAIFAERGCPLPARCSLALKRMWLLMDIPDNARRIATIHNHRLFTDLDLYFLMCFFVKLDMVANDPVALEKRDGLRKLLLSQQGGLHIILKVLKRETWKRKSDYLIAWVKNTMNMDNLTEAQLNDMGVQNVFGIPKDQVGSGKFEYWGLKGIVDETTGQRRPYLLRPDQLVMREAIRRGLRFNRHFMRCVLYGYVRPDTLENYEARRYGRRADERLSEEYDTNDNLGGTRAFAVEDGGDALLDLGNTCRGSRYIIRKEIASKQERAMRDGSDRFLTRIYAISEQEQEAQARQAMEDSNS